MASEQLVLIVDSDPREQRVLAVALRKAGLNVRGVTDANAALRVLDEEDDRLGVVIVELNITGIDGFELCERIREMPRYDSIALIAVTGSRDLATKLRAFETGFDELVTKPIYVKELATRVELMLERKARDLLALAEAQEVDGNLGTVPLVDLLQAIGEHRRTGFVRVESADHIGEVHFTEGEVIDAETGGLRGESALFRMLRWTEGYYAIKYLSASRRRRRIDRPAGDVVADGLERIAHWNDLAARVPLDRAFEVDWDGVGDELEAMPPAVRTCLRLFDGYRTLLEVVQLAPVGDLEALRLAARLFERGQLIDAGLGAETDALDEAARNDAVAAWLGDDVDVASADVEPSPSWSTQPRPAVADVAETRRRLEKARAALEDEQSRVLAKIARNEAAAAREQEARARADLEERHQRETSPRDAAGEAEAHSVRAQVMASLAEVDELFEFGDPSDDPFADAAAAVASVFEEERLPLPAAERTPERPLDAAAVAWEARVQEHVRLYRVVTTAQSLQPRTIVTDDMEPVATASQAIYDRARLLVSDVYDSVDRPLGPGATDDLDLEPEPEPVEIPRPSGPSTLQGQGFRRDRPAVEVVRPSQVGLAASAKASIPERAEPEPREEKVDVDRLRATVPGVPTATLRRDKIDPVADTPLQVGDRIDPDLLEPPDTGQQAAPLSTPAPVAEAPASPAHGMEPLADESPSEAEAVLDPPEAEPESAVDTPRERPTRVSVEESPSPVATVASEPEPKAGDSFSEAFFTSDNEAVDDGGAGGSRLGTIAALLILVILVGAFVYLMKQGSDADEAAEEASADRVSAEGPAPEATSPTPDVVDADPEPEGTTDEIIEDPTTDPFYLAAQTEGRAVAEWIGERAPSVAEEISFGPASEPEEAAPEPAVPTPEPKPEPKPDPKPEPKPDPKPEPKPDPKPEPKPKPEETDPKPEPKPEPVAIEKKSDGGKAFKQGQKAFKKGKWKEAVAKLEDAVAEKPGNTEAHYLLGRALAKDRQYPKAIKHLEKARSAKKGSSKYWTELGNVYIAADKKKQGREAYEKAIELDPDGSNAEKLRRYLEQFN